MSEIWYYLRCFPNRGYIYALRLQVRFLSSSVHKITNRYRTSKQLSRLILSNARVIDINVNVRALGRHVMVKQITCSTTLRENAYELMIDSCVISHVIFTT